MNKFEKIVTTVLIISTSLGIALILIILGYYDIFRVSQLSADWGLTIASVIATSVLVVITFFQMREAKKLRTESVRPCLSLEPATFVSTEEFHTLLLANSSNIARDVEIDVLHIGKKSLFYIPSIGTSQKVPILNGNFPQDGGIADVFVKYKDINNTEYKENLSVNFSSIVIAKRKSAYVLSTTDVLSKTIYEIKTPLEEVKRALDQIKQALYEIKQKMK